MMFEKKYLQDRFLFAEGEPYGEDDTVFVNDDGKPISLWSAIQLMREEEPEKFAEMSWSVWGIAPDLLLTEAVMLKAIENRVALEGPWKHADSAAVFVGPRAIEVFTLDGTFPPSEFLGTRKAA